jgi:catechol 2,3-dioxygenase-like lactoylglutathione lyase family enzyme
MKKRVGDPWMSAAEYGRSLPAFSVNLIASDVDRSVAFYRDVLGADVRYSDPDFAALRLGDLDFMLHADHTYDDHPWYPQLLDGHTRGLGSEIRLFGVDPDALEARARLHEGALLRGATDKPHGWREMWLQDPDGYLWAVGIPIDT